MRMPSALSTTVAALSTIAVLGVSPAMATMIDSSYTISGTFGDPYLILSGSFDVVGGAIQNLTVTTNSPSSAFGDPSIYTGSGTNEATGTMFSAALTLTNLSSFMSGTGYLDFLTDGTFQCGGISYSSFQGCQIMTQVLGTDPNEQVGRYRIQRVSAAVPEPATLALVGVALMGLAASRRRVR